MQKTSLLAAFLALILASPAAAAIQLGTGNFPGSAIDASGTGYVGWIDGSTSSQTLRFCRVGRSDTGCSGGVKTIGPINGDLVTRVAVAVNGARVVVAHSDRVAGETIHQFAWTSADGGATFGGRRAIGTIRITDSVAAGDALMAVTAGNSGVFFQRMPIDGSAPVNPDGSSALPAAQISPETTGYNPAVGMLDATTPVVVWDRGSTTTVFSRYDGSGDVNSAANWTAPVDIGPAFKARLAGGPSGLVLLASERANAFDPGNTIARRFDGTTFGAPVTVGGVTVGSALTQDAGGRLHAIMTNSRDPNTIDLHHAVSDNGTTWRAGVLEAFPASTTGAIVHPSVNAAPDHIGFVAAATATEPGGIGVVRLGPDAPGTTPPPPAPPPPPPPPPAQISKYPSKFIQTGSSVIGRGRSWSWKLGGAMDITIPATRKIGCGGTVKVTLYNGKRVIERATLKVKDTGFCSFKLNRKIRRSKIKRTVRKLKLELAYSGSADTLPVTLSKTIRLRGCACVPR